ncbi:DUF6252 family protein [Hyunsoonleella rubra]|uniref:DUF6252 family protein n=1 Tax=Hyunsoonleella rubra TaxID=1737062 RepID=A0ABW5T7U6_9FLAO
MRNLKQIMLFVMVGSLLTFTSCSNNDDGGGPSNAGSGTLVAKVDGTSFQSMEISSSATVANAGGTKNLIIIASNSDGNAFAFTIFGYTGEGTYKLTGADIAVTNTASYTETNVNLSNPTASTTEIWQAPYDDTEVGSVSVSEETDTHVKGTFSFMGKNVNGDGSVKNITEGSFNLSKQTT